MFQTPKSGNGSSSSRTLLRLLALLLYDLMTIRAGGTSKQRTNFCIVQRRRRWNFIFFVSVQCNSLPPRCAAALRTEYGVAIKQAALFTHKHIPCPSSSNFVVLFASDILNRISQHFVHSAYFAGDRVVDCALADLDNETTHNFGVDFGGNF